MLVKIMRKIRNFTLISLRNVNRLMLKIFRTILEKHFPKNFRYVPQKYPRKCLKRETPCKLTYLKHANIIIHQNQMYFALMNHCIFITQFLLSIWFGHRHGTFQGMGLSLMNFLRAAVVSFQETRK